MSERISDWRKLLELFWTFSKIGPVTFGGGYAMIPLIEKEAVQQRRWMKAEEIIDLLAVSGAAPGAIGVNAAFAIGFRVAGLRGAIAAFLGVILPTFLIVLGLSTTYLLFKDNPKVAAAFEGIRPAIVALILYAAVRVAKTSIIDKATFVIAIVFLAVLLFTPISPIWAMVAAPFAGIGISWRKRRRDRNNGSPLQQEKSGKYVHHDYYIGEGI